jgi:hypothetical protein
MNSELLVEKLSQTQADELTKGLPAEFLSNLNQSFQDENRRRENQGQTAVWALPPDSRTYYLIRVDSNPYLLVGINKDVNISTFLKVTLNLKGFGAACLGKLIEDELIAQCRQQGKPVIATYIVTVEGYNCLKKLEDNLPRGIKEIRIDQRPGGDWSAQILLECQ